MTVLWLFLHNINTFIHGCTCLLFVDRIELHNNETFFIVFLEGVKMSQVNLATQIKDLRKKHNLTQQQLADLLSVSNKSISKWEKDEGIPDLKNIKDFL